MMIDAPAQILASVAARRSVRAFAADEVSPRMLNTLSEAARWAPSSFNQQPWRFIVTTRRELAFRLLADCLHPANGWARKAPVLMLTATKKFFPDGSLNPHAWHDAGAAMAILSLEAASLGLQVHQMAGFDGRKARMAFGLPLDVDPITITALGHPRDPTELPERLRVAETAPRQRHPLTSVVFGDAYGTPAAWVSA